MGSSPATITVAESDDVGTPSIGPNTCANDASVGSGMTQGTWTTSAMGGLTGTITVTGIASGACSFTINDGNGQSQAVAVNVSSMPTFTTFIPSGGAKLGSMTLALGASGAIWFGTNSGYNSFDISSSGVISGGGGYCGQTITTGFGWGVSDGSHPYVQGVNNSGTSLVLPLDNPCAINTNFSPNGALGWASDGQGNAYGSLGNNSDGNPGVGKVSGDGVSMVTESYWPYSAAAADGAGNVFLIGSASGPTGGLLWIEINKHGTVETTSNSGSVSNPVAVTGDGAGHAYFPEGSTIYQLTDGPNQTAISSPASVNDCAGDAKGNVYCIKGTNSSVVWINSSGVASALTMPSGATATGLIGDGSGHVWIGTNSAVVVEAVNGSLTAYTNPNNDPISISSQCTANGLGAIYCSDTTSSTVIKIHS